MEKKKRRQNRDKFFSKLTKGDTFYWNSFYGNLPKRLLIFVKYNGITKVLKRGKMTKVVEVYVVSINFPNELAKTTFDLFSENQMTRLT